MPENRTETGQFVPGFSGNPSGRPVGLARRVRELIGDDGLVLAQIMTSIAVDESAATRDRIAAVAWLADRGWGKAPAYAPIEAEADPLQLSQAEARRIALDFDRTIDEIVDRRRAQRKPRSRESQPPTGVSHASRTGRRGHS